GRSPRRERELGHLSLANVLQGTAVDASGSARRPRLALLRVAELAIAPLCRPREPVAARRGLARKAIAVHAQLGGVALRHARVRGGGRALRRASTRDGELLDPALAPAGGCARRWRRSAARKCRTAGRVAAS